MVGEKHSTSFFVQRNFAKLRTPVGPWVKSPPKRRSPLIHYRETEGTRNKDLFAHEDTLPFQTELVS